MTVFIRIDGGGDRLNRHAREAVAESFFATLKIELAEDANWKTREQARAAVFRYIEMWYNPRRRHSSLGDLSPVEVERRLAA